MPALLASQYASADANTLDDYEEAYHTVTITPATSGTVTLDAAKNTFAYTKIGRSVHVQGQITISSISSPVGDLRISLPFASTALTENADKTVGAFMSSGLNYAASYLVLFLDAGVSYFRIAETTSTPTLDFIDGGDLGGSEILTFQISYIVE